MTYIDRVRLKKQLENIASIIRITRLQFIRSKEQEPSIYYSLITTGQFKLQNVFDLERTSRYVHIPNTLNRPELWLDNSMNIVCAGMLG